MDDDRALGPQEPAAASLVLEEGTLLARKYRLARRAGFGGMAELWVATNEATGADVCVKVLLPEKGDEELVERFRREAYAAARLGHRAIVRVFDLVELGADGDTTKSAMPAALVIVMELLHGQTLADLLMKQERLSLHETIDVALPFLSALGHAHRAGVVHRDLKPENIFLATDPDGHVVPKILDFGVSKTARGGPGSRMPKTETPITLDGVMLGTPTFMSPEQARGAGGIDARSDVFSAGVLLYLMMAGKNPFESTSLPGVLSAILRREPPRLEGVPDPIWEVVARAIAKDPAARYADATELCIALRRASGRSLTTAAEAPARDARPSNARVIVTPLGGDSNVTVPPAADRELGGPADPPPGAALPASRPRRVKIVLGVVAVASILSLAALLRAPANAGRASAALMGSSTAVAVETAAQSPVAPSTGTGTGTGASVAVTPSVVGPPSVDLDAGARAASLSKPAAVAPRVAPAVKKKDTGRAPMEEPAIVRDPGF